MVIDSDISIYYNMEYVKNNDSENKEGGVIKHGKHGD